MAYEIIHDRQFIKVSEKEFVPIALIGDSNTFETNSRGRSVLLKEWHTLSLGNGLVVTEDSLKEYLEEQLNRKIELELKFNPDQTRQEIESRVKIDYGYYLGIKLPGKRKFTFQSYVNYFLNACKDAVTIEEAGRITGFHFRLKSGEEAKLNNPDALNWFRVSTTEEFWTGLGAFRLCYGENTWKFEISDGLEYIRRERKFLKRRQRRTQVVIQSQRVEYFFACSHKEFPDRFLVKYTKWGYRYFITPEHRQVRKFQTESQANSWLKKRDRNDFEAIRVNSPAEINVRTIKKLETVCH